MDYIVYLAFFIIYLICLVFLFIKNTETITFIILIILFIVFITYFIHDIYRFNNSYQGNSNYYLTLISFFTSIINWISIFISLTLVTITTLYLKRNNELQSGEPLYLSNKYIELLRTFKKTFISSSILSFILLFFFLYYVNYIKRKVFDLKVSLFILGICISILVLSYYSLKEANLYSKLRQKDFLLTPSFYKNEIDKINGIIPSSTIDTKTTTTTKQTPKVTQSKTKPTTTTPLKNKITLNGFEPEPTAVITTPTSKELNASNYENVSSLLSEPTLSYSDYCSLNYSDLNTLLNNSNLSYAEKAEFTRLKEACNNKNNTAIDVKNNVKSFISSASNTLPTLSLSKINPVESQNKWMNENSPELM